MDFDDFSKEATRVPDLTTTEQKGIRDLLAHVRRKFVKTVQTVDGRSVRHMEPACIKHVLPPDSTLKGSGFARRTVTWVCLPYITLEKYSGLQGAAENLSAFPIETLLQAKFSRTGRERDMLQAVCQSKDTPAELCYHVAQIWCLIVGNCKWLTFLFTYSRMTEETLRGDSIDLLVEPLERSPDARPVATIAVSYRQAVLWSIPVEECHTWLSFLAHFREFWPQRLQFFHRKRPVTADNWPRVWNLAKHSNTKIMLEMRIGFVLPLLIQLRPAPEPPPTGILVPKKVEQDVARDSIPGSQSQSPPNPEDTPEPSRKSGRVPGKPESTALPVLSIFSCLPGVTDPKFDNIDEEALDDHLREVEDYLLSRTTFSDRRAYTACPEATRDKVYAHLEQRGVELSRLTDVKREQQQDYETQLDIFNAADVVFKFFFPPDTEVPTTRKFWGALETIITDGAPIASTTDKVTRPLLSKHAIRAMRVELRKLCIEVQLFNEIFSQSGRPEQARIVVPKEIVEGWIHLLMALVYLPKDDDKSDKLFDDARTLISSGMATVIRSLSEKSSLDNSVFLPQELVSLFSLKLLQDSTLGMPDVSQCYSACLQELSLMGFAQEADRGAVNEPFRRAYNTPERHTELSRRSGERSHVQFFMRSKTRTTSGDEPDEHMPYYSSVSHSRSRPRSYSREEPATQYYETLTYDPTNPSADFKLAPTDPDGYRVLLLNECLHFLAGRERDFSGFRGWASLLSRVNRNKIDTTKDRHDNAIYAFTIVTIIFLPLSAISSIFGMNTSDIRDMDLGQSAYWAVALPVTALVIFLGLLWTGELGNIVGWVQSFGPRRHGYRSLPEEPFDDYPRPPPPPPQWL
ncbi:hypothetical protein MMYC01_204552 [Madurella mycetomatis]|uniref:Magnesium transport protein CorA n=1 Tax=Madurella mycetomatis TaxID=100816 RepID=A0A175W6E1_9PEZI|nr:hypothetical protein MMYC01_204552 [Madurella mycetomatis]